MDPTACLRRIDAASRALDRRFAVDDLHEWLTHGGFAPHWALYPEATRAYVKRYGYRPSMPAEFNPSTEV